ncbi:MAG: 16S rRNA (cytosine(1402)-N(4))-methyltransferase RsmH [Clostridia bacterium]|nr:16S rRNA (cytosine(1402)-N(4))-methyltransferase RsmH [Clostridia bacterium]
MAAEFKHVSVLLEEAIGGLDIKKDGIYIDCTAGGGGHSIEIVKAGGRLVCFDRDSDAISATKKRLSGYEDRYTAVHANYADFESELDRLGIDKIDGAIMDLGVSSYQLDSAERGFSYNSDARLDMRMDRDSTLSAYEVVNEYSEEELARIIFEYGEERFSRRIASKIVQRRAEAPIESTLELSEIIKSAMPAASKAEGHHPAKRTFQAIRIEVNSELSIIAPTIKAITHRLNKGGRISIITFHSLEDRAVKNAYSELCSGCICPKDFPICVCGHKPQLKLVNKKPVLPSEEELLENPRSRSAKLRIAEKI